MAHVAILFFGSLTNNYVGPELGEYMADVLKVNQTLTSIKCAALKLATFWHANFQ